MFDHPVQLNLISRAFDSLRDEQRLVGLWLGGERWLRVGESMVAAFVFFNLREGVIGKSVTVRENTKQHDRDCLLHPFHL